jgi:hypothetical protein
MRIRVCVIVTMLAAIALQGGCASVEGRTRVLQNASVGQAISPDRVQVVTGQTDADRFEQVAELQYRTPGDNFDGAAERVLMARLRREAAALGADVLLDVRITVEEDGIATTVTEQSTGDPHYNDRRRWSTTTTTARVRTAPSYRTTITAVAARRR